jgi:predicted small metal-binding protein
MTNNGKDRLQVPDKFSDTASKIQPDELDFDQLVNQSAKKIDKATKQKRQSSPPPSSGDHPFDLSFIHSMQQDSHLFMSEDEPKRSNRSFDDLHSVIGSDEDFNEELNKLKAEKEIEDKVAEHKKRAPPDVTPMRQEMIKNLKQRIRRYQTSNYDERPDITGMMGQSQSTFVDLKKDRVDAHSIAQT